MLHSELLLFFLLTTIGHHVIAETYDDRAALRASVLYGYQTDIRPLNDQNRVLNISIVGILYKILTVDAVRGAMTVVVSFVCNWYDERITWSPNDYNGTSTIKLYKNNVWIPHIILGNPIELTVFDSYFMHVQYTHEGLALYHCGNVVEMMCQFNVRYWPFDEQECVMQVFAYDQGVDDVQFVNVSVELSPIVPNAEWTLLGVEPFLTEAIGYSNAMFRLRLKRQSTYYVLQIIFPLLGIATLNPLVFLLPSASGERVSYSTTILLSITVFLTIIDESIPKTSNPLPLLVLLLSLGLLMGLATTAIVIINLHIYHRDDARIPMTSGFRRLVHMYAKVTCKSLGTKKSEVVPINVKPNKQTSQAKMTVSDIESDMMRRLSQDSKVILNEMKGNFNDRGEFESDSNENDVTKDVTWKEVSNTIDKIAFVSSFGMHVVVCSAFVCFLVMNSGTSTS